MYGYVVENNEFIHNSSTNRFCEKNEKCDIEEAEPN